MTLMRWKPLGNVSRWTPVRDLTGEVLNMQDDIDRMFDRLRFTIPDEHGKVNLTPSVDVIENENDFTVTVELPGVDKKDVKITIVDDILTLKGEKKHTQESKSDGFQRLERTFGSFERSFTLPTSVQSDKIEASYTNGILTISIPKAEQSKAKEIEVHVK